MFPGGFLGKRHSQTHTQGGLQCAPHHNTIGHQVFNHFVNLLWFLALPTPFTADDVFAKRHVTVVLERATVPAPLPHQAHLLGVLQIVTVAFCQTAVDCEFDPHYFIHEAVGGRSG